MGYMGHFSNWRRISKMVVGVEVRKTTHTTHFWMIWALVSGIFTTWLLEAAAMAVLFVIRNVNKDMKHLYEIEGGRSQDCFMTFFACPPSYLGEKSYDK
jgi:hypothetical protein